MLKIIIIFTTSFYLTNAYSVLGLSDFNDEKKNNINDEVVENKKDSQITTEEDDEEIETVDNEQRIKENKALIGALTAKAKKNDVNAMFELGQYYYEGNIVKLDLRESFRWLKKAAKKNNSDAQYVLGRIFFYGEGGRKNYREAMNLWKKAAQKDNKDAIYQLGLSYYYGEGVKKNTNEGCSYFFKGHLLQDYDATYAYGMCFFKGSGREDDAKKAFDYIKIAADNNHADGLLQLSRMYANGLGVAKNIKLAEEYSQKAEKVLKSSMPKNEVSRNVGSSQK